MARSVTTNVTKTVARLTQSSQAQPRLTCQLSLGGKYEETAHGVFDKKKNSIPRARVGYNHLTSNTEREWNNCSIKTNQDIVRSY